MRPGPSVSRNSTRCKGGNSRARLRLPRLFPPLECPGCGARIVRRALDGACILRPLPLLRLAASAAGGARLRSLRQNFAANRALVTSFLAHNLPQNFPVGVAVVGACPPTATDFILFRSLRSGRTGVRAFLLPIPAKLAIKKRRRCRKFGTTTVGKSRHRCYNSSGN